MTTQAQAQAALLDRLLDEGPLPLTNLTAEERLSALRLIAAGAARLDQETDTVGALPLLELDGPLLGEALLNPRDGQTHD